MPMMVDASVMTVSSIGTYQPSNGLPLHDLPLHEMPLHEMPLHDLPSVRFSPEWSDGNSYISPFDRPTRPRLPSSPPVSPRMLPRFALSASTEQRGKSYGQQHRLPNTGQTQNDSNGHPPHRYHGNGPTQVQRHGNGHHSQHEFHDRGQSSTGVLPFHSTQSSMSHYESSSHGQPIALAHASSAMGLAAMRRPSISIAWSAETNSGNPATGPLSLHTANSPCPGADPAVSAIPAIYVHSPPLPSQPLPGIRMLHDNMTVLNDNDSAVPALPLPLPTQYLSTLVSPERDGDAMEEHRITLPSLIDVLQHQSELQASDREGLAAGKVNVGASGMHRTSPIGMSTHRTSHDGMRTHRNSPNGMETYTVSVAGPGTRWHPYQMSSKRRS